MGQAARLFALHARAQRPRCGLLSARQPLNQLALPAGGLLRVLAWDGLILSTRSRYDNVRKVLRLDDLFQRRPAANHQRRAFQLHQLFLLELGE